MIKEIPKPVIQLTKGIIFFFLGKKLLEAFGFLTGADEAARIKAAQDLLLSEYINAAKIKPLTRPATEYFSAANVIENSLNRSSVDDDADKADNAFTTIINNATDLAYLKYVYDFRPTYVFGIKEGDFDLLTTLKREFADWRKQRTVSILAGKGVALSL